MEIIEFSIDKRNFSLKCRTIIKYYTFKLDRKLVFKFYSNPYLQIVSFSRLLIVSNNKFRKSKILSKSN